MVDYSKWDNLDSGSSSDSDGAAVQQQQKKQPTSREQRQGVQQQRSFNSDTSRILEQAENLRLQGNGAFERNDLPTAMRAYEAQLQLLEGHKGKGAIAATSAALLNQASALIRMKQFGDAETRCTRLLALNVGDVDVAARTRALHFRGFSRLRQAKFEGACSDLRGALSADSKNTEETGALLAEAEAGMAMTGCPDPEARGRELLREGNALEAAKLFREAASRARLRDNIRGAGGTPDARVDLARNLRMEGVAMAKAGGGASAEILLKAALSELRKGGRGKGGKIDEEEGFILAALGGLLAHEGKHRDAGVSLRAAVMVLDRAIAAASSSTSSARGQGKAASSMSRTLSRTLVSLGLSLLVMAGPQPTPTADINLGDSAGAREVPGAETATGSAFEEEAISALKRALDMLKKQAATDDRHAGSGDLASGEGSGGVEEVATSESGGEGGGAMKQTGTVLDALSELYARKRSWEQARSAAEQALAVWRSQGEAGKSGVAASLLALGHLLLQLHGVAGGIEEASARWEEAAVCLDSTASRPSDAAEVRMKVASFYSKVARSDPSRLESLEGKIAAHFKEAAGLLARQREEMETIASKRLPTATATTKGPFPPVPDGQRTPLVAPPSMDSLETEGPSRWELAEKEALAWEGYAGVVGNVLDEATSALRKADGLLDYASVSERDEPWTLRKVGVLHNLAFALARGGDHAMAESKLMDAISQLQTLDNVERVEDYSSIGAGSNPNQGILKDLYKYLAITRRAGGDMSGASEALRFVKALGGSSGQDDVQELNEFLGQNRINVD